LIKIRLKTAILELSWLDLRVWFDYLNIMAIRKIITVTDRRLKTISDPVDSVTDETRLLMDDMLETMYAANGIGLAAIQIAVPKRILVMDLSHRGEDVANDQNPDAEESDPALNAETGPRYFVNPEIIWASDELNIYQEGCLSVPGFYDDVARPKQCHVRYLDYQGKEQVLKCDDLLATCLQHEMDHLNGIVFLDHLSRLKRDRITKKLKKEERDAITVDR
jgi:peptide deformylase